MEFYLLNKTDHEFKEGETVWVKATCAGYDPVYCTDKNKVYFYIEEYIGDVSLLPAYANKRDVKPDID